jgi:hypothetical protein
MALQYGTSWAIYLLLQTHQGNQGLQSRFKSTVDAYVNQGMSNHDAVVQATQEQIDLSVQPRDIGPLQTLTAEDLRSGLGIDEDYDPTSGDCPNGQDVGGGVILDHQKAIANALVAMTGPVKPRT